MSIYFKLNHLSLLTKPRSALPLILLSGIVSSNYAAAESIVAGKTLLAKGIVNAINPSTHDSRILKRRSKIMSVDHIITGDNSKAQFSMSDGGLITLKENTEINVSHYEFNQETQQGSATLEVISGGLRSISGLIKKTGGDYHVKTPVGSIGIRGTHFAVQVVGENVYFGVFSGNIDIELNNNETLSLGVTESFAFASVDPTGNVTPFTQAPEILSLGYTTPASPSSSTSSSDNSEGVESAEQSQEDVEATASTSVDTIEEPAPSSDNDVSETAFINDIYTELVSEEVENFTDEVIDTDIEDIDDIETQTIAELISERTGTYNYQELTQSDISSSIGDTSELTLNLAVDFDNGTVPGGSLSFSDSQGEWFATYSGLINVDQLDVNVNFASHGNALADGEISVNFTDNLDEVEGEFDLHEIDDTSVTSQGTFTLK